RWTEVGEAQILGPELIQETTEKMVQIKQRMQAAHDRQKSYADFKRKPMEFQVGDKRVGDVAYKLDLPEELSRVHNTYYVSNLKKCHASKPLAVSLDGLHFDDKLYFFEEPVEIVDHEVKRLNQIQIPLVKVRWNSKRGPEFMWEREDQFRKKYPYLFARTASTSSSYEDAFLGYAQNSKPYIVLNKHTKKVKESLNVTFDEIPPPSKTSPLVDDNLDEEEAVKVVEKQNLENDIVDETLEIDEIVNIKESRNHPLENVIGNLNQRTLRSQAQNQSNFFCLISTIEPKNVNEALGDKSWMISMQEELNEFVANDV
nr:putative reverse transcriptase domain-containing protein [Tanacetum cinerariifolium]